MTLAANNLQLEYLGVAIFMLGASYGLIKWVGRTIRDQLGPGMSRGDEPFLPEHVDTVPPALVKQAIERGLVTSSQLAGMTPMERQFLLASLKDKLAAPAAAGGGAPAPPPSPAASAPRAMDAAEFGMAAMPVSERRVHCAMCGESLDLPALAPYVAHCRRCGAKTALREDEFGHYTLSVTPATSRRREE